MRCGWALDFGFVIMKFPPRDSLFLSIYLPVSSFSPPNPFWFCYQTKCLYIQLWYHLLKSLMALLSDYISWNFSALLPSPNKTHLIPQPYFSTLPSMPPLPKSCQYLPHPENSIIYHKGHRWAWFGDKDRFQLVVLNMTSQMPERTKKVKTCISDEY